MITSLVKGTLLTLPIVGSRYLNIPPSLHLFPHFFSYVSYLIFVSHCNLHLQIYLHAFQCFVHSTYMKLNTL